MSNFTTPELIAAGVAILAALCVLYFIYSEWQKHKAAITSTLSSAETAVKTDALSDLAAAHAGLQKMYAAAVAKIDSLESSASGALTTAASSAGAAAITAAVTSLEQSLSSHATAVGAAATAIKAAVSEGTKA